MRDRITHISLGINRDYAQYHLNNKQEKNWYKVTILATSKAGTTNSQYNAKNPKTHSTWKTLRVNPKS